MAGLVAVHISTHEAVGSDVFVVGIITLGQMHREQAVEARQEPFLTAHRTHHAIDIVRHMEGEIPRIAFDKAFAVGLQGIKVGFEMPVGISWPGKADA